MFENLVISETAYELLFQESEPVYKFEEGKFGDDREQEHDTNGAGYPVWMVRVTASDAVNREEQVLEVQVAMPEQPVAAFKAKVLLPNLRVQMYSRRQERTITARWFADSFGVDGDPVAPASSSRAKKAELADAS